MADQSLDRSFPSDFSSDTPLEEDSETAEARRQYGSDYSRERAEWRNPDLESPERRRPRVPVDRLEDDGFSGGSREQSDEEMNGRYQELVAREQALLAEAADQEESEEEEIDMHDPDLLRHEYIGRRCMEVIDKTVDDSFLTTEEPGAVSRLVVIDAANALHGWTPLYGGENLTLPPDQQRVDAAYILSLVRFFVSRGIECMVVAQHKYMLDNVVENTFIMNKLREQGLMMVMDRTYDDLVLFNVAGEFDAVILSEDQFRGEQQRAGFLTPNTLRALQMRVAPIYPRRHEDFLPKEEWCKVSRNGHFVVDHLLRFDGSTEVLRQKLFSTADRDGHRHELVYEKWESWQKRKDRVLVELDLLLVQMQRNMEAARKVVPHVVPRGN